jgi:hypothetical protein
MGKVIEKKEIPGHAYFIRLSDDPDWFIHNVNGQYLTMKGTIGASVWYGNEVTNRFIDNARTENLEAVKVKDILKV